VVATGVEKIAAFLEPPSGVELRAALKRLELLEPILSYVMSAKMKAARARWWNDLNGLIPSGTAQRWNPSIELRAG